MNDDTAVCAVKMLMATGGMKNMKEARAALDVVCGIIDESLDIEAGAPKKQHSKKFAGDMVFVIQATRELVRTARHDTVRASVMAPVDGTPVQRAATLAMIATTGLAPEDKLAVAKVFGDAMRFALAPESLTPAEMLAVEKQIEHAGPYLEHAIKVVEAMNAVSPAVNVAKGN